MVSVRSPSKDVYSVNKVGGFSGRIRRMAACLLLGTETYVRIGWTVVFDQEILPPF